jgi:hypothetical protein
MKEKEAASSVFLPAAAVFLIAGAAFIFLRSPNYFAVDGALRALEVYQKQRPFLHPNNHLLYPFNLYLWSTLLHALRIRPGSPLGFLAIAQSMNAIAAAASAAMLYGIAYLSSRSALAASLAAGGWGVSRAVLAHATNSAEPMVGVLWSIAAVALALYGIARHYRWTAAAAGLLLALAMATYQTTVLLGAPIFFLLCQYPASGPMPGAKHAAASPSPWRLLKSRLPDGLWFLAGFTAGIPIIYGPAYYLSGTRGLAEMFHRFLRVDAAQVYGGASAMKAAAVLPGLAYALFPCLPQQCGFRCLAAPEYRLWIPVAAAAVSAAAAALAALLVLARRAWRKMTARERAGTVACGIAFLATVIPSVVWMPAYDKFWLQPLACLFLGAAVVLPAAWRTAGGPRRRARLLLWLGGVFIAVLALSNLAAAWNAARQPPPSLAEAQEVARLTATRDLVVGDWNSVFLLYDNLWAARGNGFNLPTQALPGASSAAAHLQDAIQNTRKTGGRIFFLGLLDLSESEWKPFLGDQLKLPYSAVAEYRRCSQVIRSFPAQDRTVTLRQYTPCGGAGGGKKESAE